MTAPDSDTSGETTEPAAMARLSRLHPAAPAGLAAAEAGPKGPEPRDFLGGAETRLRDLLAFAMAAESGRPLGAEAVEALRRKADAELHDQAFRLLHNQVEKIRRQAIAEQAVGGPRALGFGATVAATLVALLLGGAVLMLAFIIDPQFLARMANQIAGFLAQLSVGS